MPRPGSNPWHTERRTKAALASRSDDSSSFTSSRNSQRHNSRHYRSRPSAVAANSGSSNRLDGRTTNAADEESNSNDSSIDEEQPGAYALTRDQSESLHFVDDECWDPTEPSQHDQLAPPVTEQHLQSSEQPGAYARENSLVPDKCILNNAYPAPPRQANAEHFDESENSNAKDSGGCLSWWSRRPKWICATLVVLALFAGTGAGAMIALLGKTSDEDSSLSGNTNLCDRSNENYLSDPFLQCDCVQRIEMTNEALDAYNRIRSLDLLRNHLDNDLQSESCDAENVALASVATEVVTWETRGDEVPPERLLIRFVLRVVYAKLEGRGWTAQTHWLSDLNECVWEGIKCDGVGGVTSLIAQGGNLEGTLDSRIGLLHDLKKLDLSWNAIGGPIPLELWSLPNLEVLLLDRNKLNGTLPSSMGEFSQSLQQLSLSENVELGGPLPFLSGLSNLRDFSLNSSRLTGTLDAGDFAQLSQLENLDLSFTIGLTGTLPSTIKSMTSLKNLRLQQTGLMGTIPEWIGDLSSLELLNLGANRFTGSIPARIGRLAKLVTFNLESNGRIDGFLPSELANCSQLESISLTQNRLKGTLPAEFANLLHLESLRLSDNEDLTGTVPIEYVSLENLLELNIHGTAIKSPIPNGICEHGHQTQIVTNEGASDCSCCIKLAQTIFSGAD